MRYIQGNCINQEYFTLKYKVFHPRSGKFVFIHPRQERFQFVAHLLSGIELSVKRNFKPVPVEIGKLAGIKVDHHEIIVLDRFKRHVFIVLKRKHLKNKIIVRNLRIRRNAFRNNADPVLLDDFSAAFQPFEGEEDVGIFDIRDIVELLCFQFLCREEMVFLPNSADDFPGKFFGFDFCVFNFRNTRVSIVEGNLVILRNDFLY